MWNLKKYGTNELIYNNRNSHICRKQTCGYQGEKRVYKLRNGN